MLSRRQILLHGLRTTALVPVLPYLGPDRSASGEGDGDPARTLVVIQLTGGNDGLNTVIPFGQDAYYRLRPNLSLPPGAIHRLEDGIGLHPALGRLHQVYQEGHLAIVQGVGYPGADRSHFRSMEIWHTADPDHPAGETGWLGRMADTLGERYPGSMPALVIDPGDLPLSMRGERVLPPTLRDPRGFHLAETSPRFARLRDSLLAEEASSLQGNLAFLDTVARTTYDAARRMQAIATSDSGGDYPATGLGRRLRLVSQLIRGGFGTRIFHLSLTGFDTHSHQGAQHRALLAQLGDALAAFQHDLEAGGVAEGVLTLVFSEFGRRVAENASKGTDHGQGAPLFLMGAAVAGGLHGPMPDLDDLVEGDIPGRVDFRGVYTLLERDWMGVPASTRIEAAQLLAG